MGEQNQQKNIPDHAPNKQPDEPLYYVKEAWKIITREKSWKKTIISLVIIQMIPIFGWLYVKGYAAEWGGLVLWGHQEKPNADKNKKRYTTGHFFGLGFKIIIVNIVYLICITLIINLISNILSVFSPSLSSAVQNFLSFVARYLLIPFLVFMALRITVYRKISAGFNIKFMHRLLRSDFKGFLFASIPTLVFFVLGGLHSLIVYPIAQAESIKILAQIEGTYSQVVLTQAAMDAFRGLALLALVSYVIFLAISAVFEIIQTLATAVWMKKFNVASWGEPSDCTYTLLKE